MTKEIIVFTVMGGLNLIGLLIVGCGIRDIFTAWRTLSWEKTSGKLVEVDIEEIKRTHNRRSHLVYEVKATYQYDAGGRPLTGHNITRSYLATDDREEHTRLLQTLKSIPSLTVYYDPLAPEKCTLVPGLDGGTFFSLVVGIMWLAATAGITGMILLIQGGDPELIRSISMG